MYDPAVMAKGPSAPLFCWLAVAMGCATAQPGPPDTASIAPPPDEASRPPPLPVVQPSRSGEATAIAGPDALVGLCRVLREESAVDSPGNPVERARASASHAQRRQAAQAASYVAVVPAPGFSFRTYQMGERRLLLDTDRSLVLGDGAELFVPSGDLAPGFSLAPDFAEHLLAERGAGRLGLRLVFRPARSQLRKDGCVWLGGGRVVKMEIDIVAAALLGADGEVVARADGGDYGDPSGGLPVRSPTVTVHKPRGPDGKDVPAQLAGAMEPLASAALPCYRRVLLVRPALRGTLVLAIRVGAGGKVDETRVEMSSLGDDAVSACVLSAVKQTELAGPVRDQRFSVPLQFLSTDDR